MQKFLRNLGEYKEKMLQKHPKNYFLSGFQSEQNLGGKIKEIYVGMITRPIFGMLAMI